MNALHQRLLEMPPLLLATIYFIMIFTLNWLGYRTRKKQARLHPDKETVAGPAEGSLLGLMALLLAFSFGMASTKFENRRQQIVDEATIINTAILRCDLYTDSAKQWMLPDFKQYLESRIDYYDAGDSPAGISSETVIDNTNKYFKTLWNKTLTLTKDQQNRSQAEQMVPVLISMKNIVAAREALRLSGVPLLIVFVLTVLIFVSSFIIGYGVKPGNRNPVLAFAFTMMTTAVIFLIMELSRPTQGLINLESAQQNMIDLRKLF